MADDQNQIDPGGDAPIEEASLSHRSASVRLRGTETPALAELGSRMDPANESLADALRITFFLLKSAMVVLVVLYLLSGLQSIKEGQSGINVRFGRQVEANLEPGFEMTMPYPFGEIVRIGKGTVEARVDRAFMPYIEPGRERDVSDNDLSTGRSLDPERDGSIITADRNLAHTQWTVTYKRQDSTSYAANVLPTEEKDLVEAVVARGAVQAVAEITIDDLLKDAGVAASRVREISQKMLDDLNTGIQIEQVVLYRKVPPPYLADQFSRVNNATQQAGQARKESQARSRSTLNTSAGGAADLLIHQIERYEVAVELGNHDEAARLLETIDALMLGQPVEIDGEVYQQMAGGEVTEILATARNDAFRTKSEAQAQFRMYEAKLKQYEASPSLMMAQEWIDAFGTLVNRDFVQVLTMSNSHSGELLINADPDIERMLEAAKNRMEAEEAQQRRMNQMQEDRYRSRRGVQRGEEGP